MGQLKLRERKMMDEVERVENIRQENDKVAGMEMRDMVNDGRKR